MQSKNGWRTVDYQLLLSICINCLQFFYKHTQKQVECFCFQNKETSNMLMNLSINYNSAPHNVEHFKMLAVVSIYTIF